MPLGVMNIIVIIIVIIIITGRRPREGTVSAQIWFRSPG
jgi:hypothetical protein